MKRRTFLRTASIASVGVTGLSGCTAPGDDGADTETTEPADETETTEETGEGEMTTETGEAQEVLMVTDGEEFFFDPIGLFVESGATVTFVIDSGSHSSTAYAEGTGGASETRIPEDAEPWDSGTLTEEGATFEHTFETPGTYDYFCIPHKALGMVGRIVVDEPGGPAEGSMPPDGDVPESQTIVDQGSVSYDEFSG